MFTLTSSVSVFAFTAGLPSIVYAKLQPEKPGTNVLMVRTPLQFDLSTLIAGVRAAISTVTELECLVQALGPLSVTNPVKVVVLVTGTRKVAQLPDVDVGLNVFVPSVRAKV